MEKVQLGVIGCGGRIQRILALLYEKGGVEIKAIYDPNHTRIALFKGLFGEEIKVCQNYQDVLAEENINWIFVGSINKFHKEQLVAAMQAGKHIFSEKPLAISVEECEEIKKSYDEKQPLFIISYPLRYSPVYLTIKNILDSGQIGKIISFEFNENLEFEHGAAIRTDWRRFEESSGGHILEKCCHDMDIGNWITGSVPKKVASFGGLNCFTEENKGILEELENRTTEEEMKKFKRWEGNPFTIEKTSVDNQVVILEYRNGVRASFHTSLSNGIAERRMYICGTEGTLISDVISGEIRVKKLGPNERGSDVSDEAHKGGHGGGDVYLVDELRKVIFGGKAPEASMEDAIKSAVTSIEIDRARKTGEVVDLDASWEKFGI